MNKISTKRVLINMSNIHGGGALQVAISFVSELFFINKRNWNVTVLISSEIASGVDGSALEISAWNFEIFDTYGLKTLVSNLNKYQKQFDVVYTLFGPKYTLAKANVDIVGFAQLWILEFDNPISSSLSFLERSKLRLKFSLQKWFFQRADRLVVELEHVKRSLAEKHIFNSGHISVVHNTLSSLYLDSKLWQDVAVNHKKGEIAIGFVTRDYSHKNIKILPRVAKILNEQYRLPVRFYLSLNDSEWANYQQDFNGLGETVGSLNVYQCPRFYEQMDAVIFPSLLECFSATPLEALAMKKPLFASDRGFVRDVCKEYAIYFDPLDADNIARVIGRYFMGAQKSDDELEAARNHVFAFSNAKQRAQDYLNIIQQHLED
jgi:glycosyltransferase involved in cell wall biosynthesis